ncbi:MFS transporter, OPA family, solute carrier family 37 (glycerol-3-phosphate transporter), member 1/2 [Trypanosoma cruzi]|nr:hypothetical protein TcBrA4_0062270 [Trypanosoma cruzi]RNF24764.1 MFS transporter, OPA family, solute carrier family 37 (glycerol-3-phosphate transporter), member 1/2 [Trypanosoma cruzi]
MFRTYNGIRFFRVFLTLWITYAAYTMVRRPLTVARADIQRETGFTSAETSLVDTMFVFSYALGQFFYGRLKGRCGNKEMLLRGILLSSAALAILGISSRLPAFCVAWAINGIAQAAGWATCISIINVWVFPKERGRVMGWWSTNMAAGGVIGNAFAAFLIGRGLSWRTAVEAEVGLLLAVGGVVLLALVEHPNAVGFPSVQQVEGGVEFANLSFDCNSAPLSKDGEMYMNSPRSTNSSLEEKMNFRHKDYDDHEEPFSPTFLNIIQLPGLCGICASYFLYQLVRYGFMFWLPYFAVHELNYTTEFAGYVTCAFDVGGVVGIVASGYFSDWMFHGVGRTRVILLLTVGMVLGSCCLAVFSRHFVENALFFMVAVTFVGFFAFAIDSLVSGSFLLDHLEHIKMVKQAGAISGVVGGVGSAGSTFQGVFTAVLISRSWPTLFYGFGVAGALAGASLIRPLRSELLRARKRSVVF